MPELTLRKPAEESVVIMMLYGATGVGKTTFSSTMPNPLILNVERGDESLVDTPIGNKRSIADIKTMDDFRQAWKNVMEGEWGERFDSIVIDSLTEFQDRLMDDVLSERGKTYPTLREWGIAKRRLKKMIRNVKDLGMHLLFICSQTEESDEGMVIKRPQLSGGGMSEHVGGQCDVVGYYVVERNDNGELERKIHVEPGMSYYAKHRYGDYLSSPIKPDFQIILDAQKKRREQLNGEEES